MALAVQLKPYSGEAWIQKVLQNFDHFLIDHAACERKASATGVSFVVRYPDREKIMDPMIRLAREELLHFHQVCRLLRKRNLKLLPDEKDPYINGLLKQIRNGRDEEFLDRLLVFGIVEARGTERFRVVAENHPDKELADFYMKLTEAEARHHELFVDLALEYFDEESVMKRLRELEELEFEVIQEIPIRAAVH
ncbi:MAG: tRNA-(ms[2]io[6]A)-hydroxylase [Bdellovibrionota bacterium]|jgi:tRNA-(ms[2]io[6]A)-hydroxylase